MSEMIVTDAPTVTTSFTIAAKALKDGQHVWRIGDHYVAASSRHKARMAAADVLLGVPEKVPQRAWAGLLLAEGEKSSE